MKRFNLFKIHSNETTLSIFRISFNIFFNHKIQSQNFDDVEIETVKVSEHVYMLIGAGGNIGVSIGEDGVFVIDDQFAPLTPKIEVAIKKLSNQPIKFF